MLEDHWQRHAAVMLNAQLAARPKGNRDEQGQHAKHSPDKLIFTYRDFSRGDFDGPVEASCSNVSDEAVKKKSSGASARRSHWHAHEFCFFLAAKAIESVVSNDHSGYGKGP